MITEQRLERGGAEPGGIHVVLRRVRRQAGNQEPDGPGGPHHPALRVHGTAHVADEEAAEQLPGRVGVLGRQEERREEVLVGLLRHRRRPVEAVEVEAQAEVLEQERGVVVGHPRHDVVAVDEPEVAARAVQVLLHEPPQLRVPDAGLPVRVHARQAPQQGPFPVQRQHGREQHGQGAAEAVPRHHEAGARVRGQHRAQPLADGVVRVRARRRRLGELRWPPGVLLQAQRLHEAAVDLAHAGDLVPREVHVRAPLLRVERLRAAERDHHELRVRGPVREHEGLGGVGAAEFCRGARTERVAINMHAMQCNATELHCATDRRTVPTVEELQERHLPMAFDDGFDDEFVLVG